MNTSPLNTYDTVKEWAELIGLSALYVLALAFSFFDKKLVSYVRERLRAIRSRTQQRANPLIAARLMEMRIRFGADRAVLFGVTAETGGIKLTPLFENNAQGVLDIAEMNELSCLRMDAQQAEYLKGSDYAQLKNVSSDVDGLFYLMHFELNASSMLLSVGDKHGAMLAWNRQPTQMPKPLLEEFKTLSKNIKNA